MGIFQYVTQRKAYVFVSRQLLKASLTTSVDAVADTLTGRTLVALIAGNLTDPELARAWRERFITSARNQHQLMIERAIARGEISKGSDVDVLMLTLYGPATTGCCRDACLRRNGSLIKSLRSL